MTVEGEGREEICRTLISREQIEEEMPTLKIRQWHLESWKENLEREYRARRSIGRRSCGSRERLTSQRA